MVCNVKLVWDEETRLWSTEADDVLRLVLESNSFDTLVERVRLAAPEMLELNHGYKGLVQLCFEVERVDILEQAS